MVATNGLNSNQDTNHRSPRHCTPGAECDLVIATFGRGLYILDDYSPLRNFKKEILKKDGYIFPIKDAKMYVQSNGFDNQGSMYYKSPNPEFGATFTYL